jgi:cell division protein FtsL
MTLIEWRLPMKGIITIILSSMLLVFALTIALLENRTGKSIPETVTSLEQRDNCQKQWSGVTIAKAESWPADLIKG